MSAHGPSEAVGVYVRVAGVVIVVIVAGVVGLWLGGRSARSPVAPSPATSVDAPAREAREGAPSAPPSLVAPLYLYASVQPGADLEAVAGEVSMAVNAGIHNYVLRVSLPWPDQGPEITETLYPLDRIEQADPEANILLAISMNPPEAWLAAHPDAVASDGSHPCTASETWLEASRQALSDLMGGIVTSTRGNRIVGFVLGGLEEDRWQHSGDYDRSDANTAGFRAWLRAQYQDEEALRSAWGDDTPGFDAIEVPPRPENLDTQNVFFDPGGEREYVDYLRYVSESTADAISNFAAYLHQAGPRSFVVLVPYGYSFELLNNDGGHCALSLLLDGVVDGFVSPVSYRERGLGGPGGFMGPVNSAGYHGKEWFILDDTRTGVSRNAITGQIERIEGLRAEDIINVQRRNFAAVLAHGLGVFWGDAQGVGSLHEARMWDSFGRMREAYEEVWSQAAGAPRYPTPEERVGLTVVVDEPSRFFQRCDAPLNRRLLADIRDNVLHAGVPTQFCLLQDVLDGRAARSLAYIFVNAFHLHEEDRNKLQNIMIEQNAAAVWMYASGYIDQAGTAENISRTTGFSVKPFEEPTRSGSVYQLAGGRWIEEGREFGSPEVWSPLFYIDADDSKALARYRDNNQISVAIEFFETGWASIYAAEPSLPPELIREILTILEEHVYLKPDTKPNTDTMHFGPGLFAIHASSNGERELDMGTSYDVHDLLDTDVGWLDKQQLTVPMKLGDTRILRVTPPQVHVESEGVGPETERDDQGGG